MGTEVTFQCEEMCWCNVYPDYPIEIEWPLQRIYVLGTPKAMYLFLSLCGLYYTCWPRMKTCGNITCNSCSWNKLQNEMTEILETSYSHAVSQ